MPLKLRMDLGLKVHLFCLGGGKEAEILEWFQDAGLNGGKSKPSDCVTAMILFI